MSYRALKKFKPGSKNRKKSKNDIDEEKNDIRGRKKSKSNKKNNKKIK